MQIQNKRQVVNQISNLQELIKKLADTAVQTATELVYSYVITDWRKGAGFGSPILKGVFINNHILSINAPSNEVRDFPEASPENPKSPPTISQYQGLIKSVKVGDTVYITNNLDYASAIENYGWSKYKTPQGVYRVSAMAASNYLALVDWNGILKSNGVVPASVRAYV